MTTELDNLVEKQSKLYDNGKELRSDGELVNCSWRFFEVQKDLIKKVQHLQEIDDQSETARKAMMIGLNVMAAPYVSEEYLKDLEEQLEEGDN